MKKYILILLSIALVACVHDNSVTYHHFTRDDLSHLYYDKDTLTSTGLDIHYKDSVKFLLNHSVTIGVVATTEIQSSFSQWTFFENKVEDIFGSSLLYFNKKTGFNFLYISVSRTSDTWNSEKFFQISANGINGFEKQYLPNDTVSLDTALVLGKIYQNVYKFYPPLEGKSDIRLIYFAKKYGYIKIEKLDGTKIERIDTGK